MTETEKAYVAGLVDGEGTIGMQWINNRYSTGPYVQIANTHKGVIDWVSTTTEIGHKAYEYDRHPEKQKKAYLLQYRGLKGIRLLKEISPYLIIKRKQAEVILNMWKDESAINKNPENKWGFNNRMPQDIVQRRKDTYDILRALNKKGPPITKEE